jgi:hypothetical protein
MTEALRIATRQTTYWEFLSSSKSFRVHFVDKYEHHFSDDEFPMFEIVTSHPVLVDYQFPRQAFYISSSPQNPQGLFEQVAATIAAQVSPWRSSSAYFNQDADALAILTGGHGLLLRGPAPLVDLVSHQLAEAGVAWRALPESPPRWPMKALIAGNSFVVAKEFRVEET